MKLFVPIHAELVFSVICCCHCPTKSGAGQCRFGGAFLLHANPLVGLIGRDGEGEPHKHRRHNKRFLLAYLVIAHDSHNEPQAVWHDIKHLGGYRSPRRHVLAMKKKQEKQGVGRMRSTP